MSNTHSNTTSSMCNLVINNITTTVPCTSINVPPDGSLTVSTNDTVNGCISQKLGDDPISYPSGCFIYNDNLIGKKTERGTPSDIVTISDSDVLNKLLPSFSVTIGDTDGATGAKYNIPLGNIFYSNSNTEDTQFVHIRELTHIWLDQSKYPTLDLTCDSAGCILNEKKDDGEMVEKRRGTCKLLPNTNILECNDSPGLNLQVRNLDTGLKQRLKEELGQCSINVNGTESMSESCQWDGSTYSDISINNCSDGKCDVSVKSSNLTSTYSNQKCHVNDVPDGNVDTVICNGQRFTGLAADQINHIVKTLKSAEDGSPTDIIPSISDPAVLKTMYCVVPNQDGANWECSFSPMSPTNSPPKNQFNCALPRGDDSTWACYP